MTGSDTETARRRPQPLNAEDTENKGLNLETATLIAAIKVGFSRHCSFLMKQGSLAFGKLRVSG